VNQVSFSLHNYTEMHVQQNIKKKVHQVSSLVTTKYPATYITVITQLTVRFRNNLFHKIKKTLSMYVRHMKLVDGSQD